MLNQDARKILEGHRERDMEKQYRPEFKKYEEWKVKQGGEPVVEEALPEKKKKKGFNKFDLIFLGLGFLVALLWRGCRNS